MKPARRLACLRLVALAAFATLAGGCGFQPVNTASLPFQTLYVTSPTYSSFGAEFRRFVESYSRTQLADAPAGADAVLEILGEAQEKQILSLSTAGRVREFLLRYRVSFRLRDAAGRELIPADTIVLERDLTYDDDAVLAKENEEAFLYRDMQMDAVQQLVRRLAVADLAGGGAGG
jgi:LPS-assembly lipoprotein